MMKCQRCGCELEEEYCFACQQEIMSEAIARIQKERDQAAKHFRLIPEEKYQELREKGLV